MKPLLKHHQLMINYLKVLIDTIQKPAFIFLGFLAASVMGFFSLLIFWVEAPSNPKMSSWLDSAYFTVSTMTSVGYGDITPHTNLGKVISILMMLIGTFIFVSFTGVVASAIIEADINIQNDSQK